MQQCIHIYQNPKHRNSNYFNFNIDFKNLSARKQALLDKTAQGKMETHKTRTQLYKEGIYFSA